MYEDSNSEIVKQPSLPDFEKQVIPPDVNAVFSSQTMVPVAPTDPLIQKSEENSEDLQISSSFEKDEQSGNSNYRPTPSKTLKKGLTQNMVKIPLDSITIENPGKSEKYEGD